MNNLCPRCQVNFSHYTEYHEHMAMGCMPEALTNAFGGLKTWVETTPSVPLKAPSLPCEALKVAKQYQGPMDKQLKARLVKQGEARLGLRHFIGFGTN